MSFAEETNGSLAVLAPPFAIAAASSDGTVSISYRNVNAQRAGSIAHGIFVHGRPAT
jgi:hypothetical protein